MIENGYEACFFCGEKADYNATIEVAMYTNVSFNPLTGIKTWTQSKVNVPRCRACKKNHNRIAWWRGGLGALGVALGVAVGIVVASFISPLLPEDSLSVVIIIPLAVVILMPMLGMLGVAIGNTIGKHFVTYQMRPEKEKVQYPAIQELMEQGWRVGKGSGRLIQWP